MKLTLNELSKHLRGRVLWLVMIVLIIINVVFCVRDGNERFFPEQHKSLEMLKEAEQVIKENPEECWEYYQAMLSVYEVYNEARDRWWEEGVFGMPDENGEIPKEPETPNFPSTYYEGQSDFSFLNSYYSKALRAEEYEALITEKREIARQTVFNYQNSGYAEDSYAYLCQVEFWIQYGETLESVHPDGSATYGWDLYWQYEGTGLFLLLAAIFAGCSLFAIERSSGMDPVVRACRRGRGILALSKVGATALWMLAASIVFHLSSLLTAAYQCGLSSPFAPIQQTKVMIYCPYPLSQLGAFLLTILFSALAALVVCLFTAGLTLLLRRTLPAIAVSAVLVGSEFVLADGANEFLANVNLLTATSGNALWSRWAPIHIGQSPVSIFSVILIVLALLTLVTILICTERWVHSGMGQTTRRIALPQLFGKIRLPKWVPKFRTVRLFPYEWHKIVNVRMGLICILLIAVQIGISLNTLDGEPTYYDQMKARYTEEYADLSLVDAEAAVSERLSIYAEATEGDKASEMARECLAGKITYEEYSAYCDLLNEALTHKDPLGEYHDELIYLIEKGETLGVETRPVLSTGFVRWMKRPFDLPVVLILFVLLAGIFAREHETKIYPLVRTTAKGRLAVWRTKVRLALICSLIVSVGALALDLLLLLTRYPTDFLSAPLVCISRYSNTESVITAGQYLTVLSLLRMVAPLVWGLLITALSELLSSEWLTAGCLLVLFLPYGLVQIGIRGVQWLDFTMLLSGDRLWLMSTELGGVRFFALFILIIAALVAGLTAASQRKYCR